MRALRWMIACSVVLGCAPREEFCPFVLPGDEEPTGCITFEEAAELAKDPYSGVHTVTIRRDPDNTAAAPPFALNGDAICRVDTCYVRWQGELALNATPSPGQDFLRWSGCSDSTEARITLRHIRRDSECVAHFVPHFIVVTASVVGWYDQHVQLNSSLGCSATDSCVTERGGSVTLVAPSDPNFEFFGWSGCTSSSALTITLENLQQSTHCAARYQVIGHQVTWSASAGGSARLVASGGPDNQCEGSRCTVIDHGSITLEASPDARYTVAGWSCGDVTTPTLRLEDITADTQCEARFVSAQ